MIACFGILCFPPTGSFYSSFFESREGTIREGERRKGYGILQGNSLYLLFRGARFAFCILVSLEIYHQSAYLVMREI